jgi:hypothetical protein
VGIPESLELPRTKSGFRDKSMDSKLIEEKEKAKIAQMFKTEIELMKYTL